MCPEEDYSTVVVKTRVGIEETKNHNNANIKYTHCVPALATIILS